MQLSKIKCVVEPLILFSSTILILYKTQNSNLLCLKEKNPFKMYTSFSKNTASRAVKNIVVQWTISNSLPGSVF